MPITLPPKKATARAPGRPWRAAAAVRTLALVATRMPMKPARAEQKAPVTKEIAVIHCPVACMDPVHARSTVTTATKIASTRYSRARNAMAPSWMWPAIFFMVSSPAS